MSVNTMSLSEIAEFVRKTGDLNRWTMDEVSYHNKGEILLYTRMSPANSNGKFIQINADGYFFLGTYQGAYHFITDGIFITTFRKTFASRDEALARLLTAAPGLMNVMSHVPTNVIKNSAF